MKKFTTILKVCTVLSFMMFAYSSRAQSPCSAPFVYTLTPQGVLTFSSTSTTTSSSTNFSWYLFCYTNTSFTGVSFTGTTGSYTLNLNGTYGLWSTVLNSAPSCSASTQQTFAVSTPSNSCNLTAGFSSQQGSNGSVSFLNTSSGTVPGTTYSWNFGDNTSGTTNSPQHNYAANGTYTVTLAASNNFTPSCISTQTAVVNVTSVCNTATSFTYSLGNNGAVTFVSTSTGTTANTSYSWSFGNNMTSLNSATTITFASGTYTVFLTTSTPLTNAPPCVSSNSQIITVTNTCVANAAFSLSPSGTPQLWNAFPAFPSGVTAAVWNWGDGSTSNTLYTSHTYSAAGNYSICLSVTLSCGAMNSYCAGYFVNKNSDAGQVIQVNVIDPATVGIKDQTALSGVSVSPNPGKGMFNVNVIGLNNDAKITVYDLTGKMIYSDMAKLNGDTVLKEIDLNAFNNGIYLLKAESGGKTVNKKIVIVK